MAINLRLSSKHPFLYLYGLVVVIGLFPVRWLFVADLTWPTLSLVLMYYCALTIVNWRTRDIYLLLYPLYALFYSLVLVPIGIYSYISMAIQFRNAGIIRPHGAPIQGTVEESSLPTGHEFRKGGYGGRHRAQVAVG
jgi:hypothetical protein